MSYEIPRDLRDDFERANAKQAIALDAIYSATKRIRQLNDRKESLRWESDAKQVDFHRGNATEAEVLSLAQESRRVDDLLMGADRACAHLRREAEAERPKIMRALAPIIEHHRALIRGYRCTLEQEVSREIDAILAPLNELSGQVQTGQAVGQIIHERIWEGRALHDAISDAQFPTRRHTISTQLPDGRLIPSDSKEAEEYQRELRRTVAEHPTSPLSPAHVGITNP